MSEQTETIRVLLIEDNELMARAMKDHLAQTDPAISVIRMGSLHGGLSILQDGSIDVVLLDLILPDSDGLDTFVKVHSAFPAVPIIVTTTVNDPSLAVRALRLGAQDYVIKGRLEGDALERSIRYAIERKRIEGDLRRAREELERRVAERTAELIESNAQIQREQASLRDAYDKLKEAQTQLIHTEKMEVVGRLASGVAHEVKNPLAIILQGVEYLVLRLGTSDPMIASTLNYMSDAVMRADNIVKGLLDFSSVWALETADVSWEQVIDNCFLLMRHEFAKYHIAAAKDCQPGVTMHMDRNKMEQVILNLLMNAVDAMESGGPLLVRTRAVRLDRIEDKPVLLQDGSFRVGDTVFMVEVQDSGGGVPQDVRDKIFDPFFTTKYGKGGTGLGLAIVKNIVEMHHGRIWFDNLPEGGTKVTLVFKQQ